MSSAFITGLIMGLILGGVSGIIISALNFASKDRDERE